MLVYVFKELSARFDLFTFQKRLLFYTLSNVSMDKKEEDRLSSTN